MKIPLRYDLSRVVARDHYKYALDHVRVERRDGGGAVAIASDGREYVRVPVELADNEPDGNYPAAVFREARAATVAALDGALADRSDFGDSVASLAVAMQVDREGCVVELRGNGVAATDDIVVHSESHDRPYPALPPDRAPSGEPIARVTLDPKRLLNIALALGGQVTEDMVAITIEIHGGDQTPIVVRPSIHNDRVDNAVGYLMPIEAAKHARARRRNARCPMSNRTKATVTISGGGKSVTLTEDALDRSTANLLRSRDEHTKEGRQQSFGFDTTHGFLGEEFLTWLWHRWERDGGEFTLPGGRVVGVAIDDVLQFAARTDDATVQTLRHGLPTKSPEARTALRHGHCVSHARLLIAEGSRQWAVTLHGAEMRFGSAKLPEDAEECESAEDRNADRAASWLALHEIVAALFGAFLRVRVGEGWREEAAAMARWMQS